MSSLVHESYSFCFIKIFGHSILLLEKFPFWLISDGVCWLVALKWVNDRKLMSWSRLTPSHLKKRCLKFSTLILYKMLLNFLIIFKYHKVKILKEESYLCIEFLNKWPENSRHVSKIELNWAVHFGTIFSKQISKFTVSSVTNSKISIFSP